MSKRAFIRHGEPGIRRYARNGDQELVMLIESSTHQGLVRENNEDRLLVLPFADDSALLAVADGMGGHAAGEIAAELALSSLKHFAPAAPDPLAELVNLVHEAQRFILEASRFDRSIRGMGTTLTAVFIESGSVHWVQVGDTRLYLLRSGVLEQITDDHTIPGTLLKEEKITREQARLHPYGNVLVKCLGCEKFEPDTGGFELARDDLLMLSSDGLHDLVSDQQIESALALEISLEEKLKILTGQCLEAGGRDNITAILAQI